MSTQLRVATLSTLAAALAACAGPNIKTETPADQLPALIVPAELVARAGGSTNKDSGGGDMVADNSNTRRSHWDNENDGGSDNDGGGSREPVDDDGGSNGGGGGGGGSDDDLISASPQPTAFALVVGIEKYRDVTPATGARHDAERVAEMMRQTFHISDERMKVLLDDRATRTDIVKQVKWLQQNVTAGGRIYVYFSGHGAPEPSSGVSYIVPYDGDPQYLGESALKMSDILTDLEKTKAKDVLVVADSCFSGAGGRSVLAPGTRPLVLVEPVKTTARVALLSASSGAEISGPAPGGKGGLFSKYFLQALGSGQSDMNGDGQISLKELEDWIKPRVKREAKKANRDQTPSLQIGRKIGDPQEFIVGWGYGK